MGSEESKEKQEAEELNNAELTYEEDKPMCTEQLLPVPDELLGTHPYCHIGVLFWRVFNSTSIGKGTGILISPNLVLTVAQNVFPRGSLYNNFDIRFYPGQSGTLEQYYYV